MPSQEYTHPNAYIHPGHGHSTPPLKRDLWVKNGGTGRCVDEASEGHPSLSYGHHHHPPPPPNYHWSDWPSTTGTAATTTTITDTAEYTTTVTMTLNTIVATAPPSGAGVVTSTLDSGSVGVRVSRNPTDSAPESRTDRTSRTSPIFASSYISSGSGSSTSSSGISPSRLTPLVPSRSATIVSSSSSSSSSSFSSTQPKTPPAASGSTITGITLGTASVIALLLLICCMCVRRRRRQQKRETDTTSSTADENKALRAQLKEAAAVQAERNKALRTLENRRTADGVWARSPGLRSKFSM